jgi:hypothetical protein
MTLRRLLFPVFIILFAALISPFDHASAQTGNSDLGTGSGNLRCGNTFAEFQDRAGASVKHGSQTIFVGHAQVSSNNQNPIVASWTTGSQDWCRDDIETNDDDGRGVGLYWDGGSTFYGIFTATGTQGSSSSDYRRFTENGWLRHYTDASPGGGGGGKVTIVLRINADTGAPDTGTFITARLSNNKTNSTKAVGIDVAPNGNVVMRMESTFHARNTDKSRMECSAYPIDHFIEFTPDLSQAVGSTASNCTPNSNSAPPPNAPVPQYIDRVSPAGNATEQPASITLRWEEDAYSDWYGVTLVGPGSYTYTNWYDGAFVCNNGTCTAPAVSLPGAGEYTWYMNSWGADTTGANIDNHPGFLGHWNETTFRVGDNPPDVIDRQGPQGNQNDPSIDFVWSHDTTAQWYRVYVVNPNGADYDQWFAATDTVGNPYNFDGVCSAGTCSVSPQMSGWWFPNGTYQWYMVAYGEGGMGDWTATSFEFTVNLDPPTPLNVNAPSNASAGTVNVQWDDNTGAAWYHIWIGSQDHTQTFEYDWFDADEVCGSGTCGIPVDMPAGDVEVWMQAWGPGGFSSPDGSNSSASWHGPTRFTVQ